MDHHWRPDEMIFNDHFGAQAMDFLTSYLTETRGHIIHRIMGIRLMMAQVVPAQKTESPWNYRRNGKKKQIQGYDPVLQRNSMALLLIPSNWSSVWVRNVHSLSVRTNIRQALTCLLAKSVALPFKCADSKNMDTPTVQSSILEGLRKRCPFKQTV